MEYVDTSPVDTFDNVETLCHATGTLSTGEKKRKGRVVLYVRSDRISHKNTHMLHLI